MGRVLLVRRGIHAHVCEEPCIRDLFAGLSYRIDYFAICKLRQTDVSLGALYNAYACLACRPKRLLASMHLPLSRSDRLY